MPYKDITKRRQAYRKWAEKNKDKRKNYQRILWLAKKANPVKQKCIVDGCNNLGERHHEDYSKPEEIIWICRTHHRTTFHANTCYACGDKILARGLCNKHYKKNRRLTEPEFNEKTKLQVRQYNKRRRLRKKESLPYLLFSSGVH